MIWRSLHSRRCAKSCAWQRKRSDCAEVATKYIGSFDFLEWTVTVIRNRLWDRNIKTTRSWGIGIHVRLIVCPVLCTLMKSFWQERFGPVASQEDRVYVWVFAKRYANRIHVWPKLDSRQTWMIWVRGVFMDTLYYTSNMKPSRWIQRCHASWFTCFTIVGRNRFVEKRAAAPVMYIVGNLFDKNGGYVVSFWWPV